MKVWKSAASFYTKLFVVMLQLRLQKSKNYKNSEHICDIFGEINFHSSKKKLHVKILSERSENIPSSSSFNVILKKILKKRKLPYNQSDSSAANRSENFVSKLLISIFCSKNFLNPNFRSKKFRSKFLNPNFRSKKLRSKFLNTNFRSRKFEPKFLNSNFWSRKFGSKIFEDNAVFSDYFKFWCLKNLENLKFKNVKNNKSDINWHSFDFDQKSWKFKEYQKI